jgi:hypothetical protein
MGVRSSIPEDGDIVIRHDMWENARVFVLLTHGHDQLVVHSRETAVRHALSAARRLQVRVWEIDSKGNSSLLKDFRLDVEAV